MIEIYIAIRRRHQTSAFFCPGLQFVQVWVTILQRFIDVLKGKLVKLTFCVANRSICIAVSHLERSRLGQAQSLIVCEKCQVILSFIEELVPGDNSEVDKRPRS